jgi:hypothetical protein
MWQAFIDLIDRRHAPRMDETKEKAAIQSVGGAIATTLGGREEFRDRVDDLIAAVGKGFTKDTAEYECLLDGFNAVRHRQIKGEKTPR